VLVKTGGNALQAVDQRALESEHVFSVIIPEGVLPGQTIFVVVPDGSGRFVSVVVPDGCFPGHNLLVKAPPPVVATGVPVDESQILVVQGEEPSDLLLAEEGQGVSEQQTAQTDEETREIEMMNQTAQQAAGTQQRSANAQSTPSQQHDRFLIRVPPGVAPGSKIRVRLSDGRMIDVAVPPGEVSQFFVEVPRSSNRQNWHDSPVAYAAPMVVAPLLL
jgi:hypothetical protein